MKHKLLLFFLCLITVLAVTACNAAEVLDAADNADAITPDPEPEQDDAPPVPGQPPTTFAQDDCLEATADPQTESLIDEARGFCLLYPASHSVVQLESGNTEIVVDSLMNHTDPRLSIVVEELSGRTLELVIDEFLAGYEGFDIAQTSVAVGDEKGIQLENIPGQDLSRMVMVAHDGFLYQLSFFPYDPGIAATFAQAEHLYRVVIDSFRFLG